MIGIRGAIQVDADTRAAIEEAVKALCTAIVVENALDLARVVSAIFTVTGDLHADFPARAARDVGWSGVPMICAKEIDVPGALPRVVRVLLHADVDGPPKHVYLRGAVALRPDLAP